MTTTGSTAPENPRFSAAAYAAVEKAADSRCSPHAPSVLERAAELLTDLWATGERHGVTTTEWDWTVDLAGSVLDIVALRCGRPESEGATTEVFALARYLLEALTSDEMGLTAKLGPSGPGTSVIVTRGPDTPRGPWRDAGADVEVRIRSDGGWDFTFAAPGASVMSIVAPASKAGAFQVAETVRAFVSGELGNVFRR